MPTLVKPATKPSATPVSAVSGDFSGVGGAIGELARFFADYMVLPELSILTMATWVQAAHFIGEGEDKGPWDQFPLLAITSPEKRCGKSTLLDLLRFVTPRADEGKFINPSAAAFYRAIEKSRPTIIMDESQSLKRRGSETSEVLREMLNASIRRDECVSRCVGDNHEPMPFSIYSPKVFAQIGDPDGILADRCLPVRLERKTVGAQVERFRYKEAKKRGTKIKTKLEKWATTNLKAVTARYDALKPFDIDNDRMADLLMPLQAVLTGDALAMLERYARLLDERDRERETQSPGIQLLMACRELFKGMKFISTKSLIAKLVAREEEPWAEWNNGRPISPEKLAGLLREYKIRSQRTPDQKYTGYYAVHFKDAWTRYLPPLGNRANPASPATRPAGYEARLSKPSWFGLTERVLAEWAERWGGRCALCNRDLPLECHHRTYENMGREAVTDLTPVCKDCHPFADEARRRTKG